MQVCCILAAPSSMIPGELESTSQQVHLLHELGRRSTGHKGMPAGEAAGKRKRCCA